MNTQEVMARVDKLLTLAGNTTNHQEAQTARKLAYNLMHKHKLSRSRNRIEGGDTVLSLPLPSTRKDNKSFTNYLVDLFGKIKSSKFIKVVSDDMVTLQVIPDQTTKSGRGVESILNSLHSMHENFMERIWNDGFSIIYKVPDHATFRIIYQSKRITFFFTVPSTHKKMIINSISQVWSKAAINEVHSDILSKLDSTLSVCAYLELKDHYFKSTLVDRTRNVPVESLISAGRNVVDDDLAILDISLTPLSDTWKKKARNARNKYREGKESKKVPTRISDILFIITDSLLGGLEKVLSLLDAIMDAEPEKDIIDRSIINQRLKPSTEQKWTHNGFDTIIRIASMSNNKTRANQTLNAIGTSFKDISGDNEFEIKRVSSDRTLMKPTSKFIEQMKRNKIPLLRLNGNILSIPEVSQIIQLPSGSLQEEYEEIESIKTKEIMIDEKLTKGGILLGEATYKTDRVKVFQPLNDDDETCLPDINIGGMGSGKTTYLANKLVEMYMNGYGGLVIDAAKREIGDEIQKVVDAGVIPKEDFVRYDFGSTRISLDWIESTRHEKGRTRLASTIIDFFNVGDDTSGQTGRFLRAAALALTTGRLSEIFDIFEDEESLQSAVNRLKEGSMAKKTLMQFKSFTSDRRRQILIPIYNRLDDILGDEVLMECMESDNTLDFIDIMSSRKIFVFDFPDDDLVPLQQDILINLLNSKIDIATRLRKKVNGVDAEFPFVVEQDEPHKYGRSAKIWTSACVESRKWRIGYVWAFHYWEQIPKGLQRAIKNALPHYRIYPTSSETWKGLLDVIAPFTAEDGLKLQRFHAINVIRAGGSYTKPFMCKMASPPSVRLQSERHS